MELKYVALTDSLYRYLTAARSNASDPVLEAVRAETDALGEISRMQISPEQGAFMTILAAAIGTKSAIEVGTFTGYSSICIGRAGSDRVATWFRGSDFGEPGKGADVRLCVYRRGENRVRRLLRIASPTNAEERIDPVRQHALGRQARQRSHQGSFRQGNRRLESKTGCGQTRRIGAAARCGRAASVPKTLESDLTGASAGTP
jgi:hypothetical protein